MFKLLMYLWTIINDLVERAEGTGESGASKQTMVVNGVNALMVAIGKQRYALKWKEELCRVINAVVAIKNLYGEFDNRKGQVIIKASILGALK